MIIFLYGEDDFRSGRKLAEIKNKFLQIYKEGGTLFVFDFSEQKISAGDLAVRLSSGGLFSSKKLAVFKNIFRNKDLPDDDRLISFLKKIKKGEIKDLTAVFWEREKFDRKSKLAKFLLKESKKQEFSFLEGAKLTSWIVKEIEKTGQEKISISPRAADKLALFVGNNLNLLSREIEKLISYKGKGEITEEDIEVLVRSRIDSDIFKTIDSLARCDKKNAARLLHDHLDAGDDPFYLLSMYFFQFRNLLKVKALCEKNVPEREISGKLKLHPFVAKKSVEQSRGFSFTKLKDLYKKLCEIDFESKMGKADIKLALDKFIAIV